ncbi:AbrB family transcriptional regulator [Alkalihalobacterium elongatum]|uniref:AbrB family transcriptional regulator n=1 Tax=Alkalihalobacterium elongatum TaxID=2675466 RepID=UPI001C1FD778|nr:AbrB family transcriptional regulator [Alkalihalobacterium elongatum]
MNSSELNRLLETTVLGFIGGYIFSLANLPLPWVLGPLTFVMLWQGFSKRKANWPSPIKNTGLIILGIYFGLYFTAATFLTIWPYFLPFLVITILIIGVSIFISTLVTKWIDVDEVTSVFGSIPGGLTEMVIASESLNAKSSLVVIFQTVRLLTVLFIVPTVIVFYFTGEQRVTETIDIVTEGLTLGGWNYLWFVLPIFVGVIVRNRIPAGIVIGPLAITAIMNISVVNLPSIPDLVLLAAQMAVGISLGKNISFTDLRLGGKYCFIYFGITLILIITSFGLGAVLAHFTSLNLATAVLSVAPGGIIEMVLTASYVGGDPAVVSALQLTRILLIIVCVPPILKWYFKKKNATKHAA